MSWQEEEGYLKKKKYFMRFHSYLCQKCFVKIINVTLFLGMFGRIFGFIRKLIEI